MRSLLACVAFVAALLPSLPAQAATKGAAAVVLTWQVLPDATAGAGGTLWCYNHVTGQVTPYALAIPNGWGNLPSDRVASTFIVAGGSATAGPEDPPSKIVTRWKDKDGFEREVTTGVTGGDSPENHARALKQHEKDVAALAARHPPAPKPAG